MSITHKEKRKQIVTFLTKELGSKSAVKSFSEDLRYLGICDLSIDKDLDVVTENGGVILQTLVTWESLGLMSKLKEIKTKINK